MRSQEFMTSLHPGPAPIPEAQQESRQVVIVGAGISGLSAAYTLRQAGIDFLVVDRAPRAGGVIETRHIEGCLVEGGPDSYLSQKPWATALIRKLGMEDDLIGSNDARRKTFIVRKGQLVPMPDGLLMMIPTRVMPMAATRLLSWPAKIRMALELFRGKPAGSQDEDRSVAEFFRSHYGQEAVDYLAEPLLAGVYGGDPEKLSAQSVLGRFVEIERRHGSLSRGVLRERKAAPRQSHAPLFRSLRNGMGSLVERLVAGIGLERFLLGSAVHEIEHRNGEYVVRLAGRSIAAKQVILALPAYASGTLIEKLDAAATSLLQQIRYNSSATVALVYNTRDLPHLPEGFGFLVPRRERRSLVAATYVQNKFPHRVPEGKILLRCFVGNAAEENEGLRGDTQLVRAVREDLQRLTGLGAAPAAQAVFRWPRAMAQYEVGHASIVAQVRERLAAFPGLHLAGNAFEGIGIPDCVRVGEDCAARCIQALAGS